MNGNKIPSTLLSIVREADNVVALTGAGISAESGVPTFRDAQTGLWAQYDPQELATPHAFQRNPQLVWEWYEWRRSLIAEAEPNRGHRALVDLERKIPSFTLITQNIDNLHRDAGSRNLIELHGNIRRNKCYAEEIAVAPADEVRNSDTEPPRCPHCGGFLRPDVIWFGESLPRHALQAATDAIQRCDLFLSIGTSALVQPAASLPLLAAQHGATTVEINPAETAISGRMDHVLRGPAGQILPALVAGAWPAVDLN